MTLLILLTSSCEKKEAERPTISEHQFKLEYISGNGQTYGGGGMPYPMVFKIKNLTLNNYVTDYKYMYDNGLRLFSTANIGYEDSAFDSLNNHCGNNDQGCFGGYYYIPSNQGNQPFTLTITVKLTHNDVEIDSYIIQQNIL